MLREEIKNIKESRRDLRKFGLTVGGILLIIGFILFIVNKPVYIYFCVAGGLLILSGLLFPVVLKPVNKIWMIFALVLGWIMSRVILITLFYIVFTPIGFIARLAGKQFLNLKFKSGQKTYWEKREIKTSGPAEYERQF